MSAAHRHLISLLTRARARASQRDDGSSDSASAPDVAALGPDVELMEVDSSEELDTEDELDAEEAEAFEEYLVHGEESEHDSAGGDEEASSSSSSEGEDMGFPGRVHGRRDRVQLSQFQLLRDVVQPPLDTGLAATLNSATAAVAPGKAAEQEDEQYCNSGLKPRVMNAAALLRHRERATLGTGCFSHCQRAHLCSFHFRPFQAGREADRMASRAYIGQYSKEGNIFVAAYQQDRIVRLYDTDRGRRSSWPVRKNVRARGLRWTITDTCLSPDQQFLLYASISPIVHMVNVSSSFDMVESIANVTEIHEALHFDTAPGAEDSGNFGIWSLRWSANRREIVAGTGNESLVIYDMEQGRATMHVRAHVDDVNAVAFADEEATLIVSGSDDRLLKVWDRRAMGRGQRPVGVLPGHTEGVTHIDPKGDGRHLISNSKDQTIKLWDLRRMMQPSEHESAAKGCRMPALHWDYRWMEYPAREHAIKHPLDVSLMTYRGHSVLQTLIRAYFSPAHTTAQRFIYAGSADGTVNIWDVITGENVQKLQYHREIVRDCSWHPYEPVLTSASFDGTLCNWEVSPGDEEGKASTTRLGPPAYDQYDRHD